MNISLAIAGVLALLRIIRTRRSRLARTGIVALICLLTGTALEVIIIYINEFGLGDPRLLAGVTAQIVTETALEAVPFSGAVIAAQLARSRLRL